jgi:pimeloyl-ACP methyl ester carboxylesterase
MKKIFLLLFLFCTLLHTQAQNSYYTTEDVQLPLKGVTLYGTLFIPAGIKNPPVVLIIAGSGPTDRDGNSPLIRGKNNSLLQLADSLARHGIASLRYDKRAIGQSKVVNLVEDSIQFSDGVNDALALCRFLETKKYKRIFIAGHSEGSLVGLGVATQFNAAGFISIAGAGRRIDLVLKEQLASLPDSLRMLSYSYLDSLAAGKRISKPNGLLYNIFRPSVQPYMISWIQYDPQQLIGSLKCPALIIQGTNDLQVKETDARNLSAAKPAATLLLIKNMNHVLKEVSTDSKTDNQKAYSNPDLPVMQELITGMVNFIRLKKKTN